MAVGPLLALFAVAGLADATQQSLIRKDPANANDMRPMEARRHQYDQIPVPSPAAAALFHANTVTGAPVTPAPSNSADASGSEADFSDRAFRLGQSGTNICQSDGNTAGAGGYDFRVARKILCEFAAQKMGYTAGHNTTGPWGTSPGSPFVLVLDDMDRPSLNYPQYCFNVETQSSVFWNPVGIPPTQQTSTSRPVCHRERFFLGTPNTTNGNCDGSSATGDSGAAGDYVQVLKPEECRTAAFALSKDIDDTDFTYGQASPAPSADPTENPPGKSNYNQWPKGCFIAYTDERVKFNVPQDASGTPQSDTANQVDPTGLAATGGTTIGTLGIPICKLNPAHYIQ